MPRLQRADAEYAVALAKWGAEQKRLFQTNPSAALLASASGLILLPVVLAATIKALCGVES